MSFSTLNLQAFQLIPPTHLGSDGGDSDGDHDGDGGDDDIYIDGDDINLGGNDNNDSSS